MGKTCAFLNPFTCTDEDRNFEGIHLGARVATMDMTKSIITYGGYDGYHFLFGRDTCTDEQVERAIKHHGWDPQSILIYDGALPLKEISNADYHTLIRLDASIDVALSLRHTLNKPIAPVTGLIHSMAYAHLNAGWTEMLLGNVLPCDAMICTSRATKEVLIRTLDLLGERLAACNGGNKPVFQGMMPVIPLGVDTDYWRPTEDKQSVKRLLVLHYS